MTKAIPTVAKYMTLLPHTIGPQLSLSLARKRFDEHKIRHLPVLSGGKIVGLLSERDMNLLATFKGVDMEASKVSDAMVSDPYVVTPDAPLTTVVAEMAERKLGSAIVVETNGTLVGIFTYIDALRTLAEVFDHRLKK